jgi:hypothetical protein
MPARNMCSSRREPVQESKMRIMLEYSTPALRAQEIRPWRAVPIAITLRHPAGPAVRDSKAPFHPQIPDNVAPQPKPA